MPRFLNTWTGEFEWHPDLTQVTYAILSHVWRKPEEGGEQSYDDVRRLQREVKEPRWVASFESDTNSCTDTSMAWAPYAFISFEEIESDTNSCTDTSMDWAPYAFISFEEIDQEYRIIFSHSGLSDKIRDFCKVARDAGFRLAWNDACCIDKTSSAELSEAINSMYEWYRLSDMCYVYLADVPDGDVPQDDSSKFRSSRWHYRGWTLQELIAPEHIIFMTKSWNVLGTKTGLAKTLELITRVDFDILIGRATLDSVSVARRMSWAAARNTTRVEDRAYSLFGIFGLHMSPIYGEGANAFLRLQEEIIRTIPDQSIFSWGITLPLCLSNEGEWSVDKHYSFLRDERCGLLASSPDSFYFCFNIKTIASSSLAQKLRIQESQVPPLHCIFTPEGVSMRLICLPLSTVPDIRQAFQELQSARDVCAECRQPDELETLALLQCQGRFYPKSILALPLFRSRPREGCGSNRRAFSIGSHFHNDSHRDYYPLFYHAVSIRIEELMKLLEHTRPKVEDVTLLHHYSYPSIPKSLQHWSHFSHPPWYDSWSNYIYRYFRDTAFEISPHNTNVLRAQGIVLSPLEVTRLEKEIILETTLAFHGKSHAGTSDSIGLRLSMTIFSDDEAEACFSVGRVGVMGSGPGKSSIGGSAGASRHTVVNAPRTSGGFLDLDSHNDGHTIIPLIFADMWRRTIAHTEYTVHSEKMRGGSARLLRIALQPTFANPLTAKMPPSHIWLSIDLSEMFQYESRTESGVDSPSSEHIGADFCERDLETSNEHGNVFPSRESSPLPVAANWKHTIYAIRDNVEALRQENNAQTARTAPDAHDAHDTPSLSPITISLSAQSPPCGGFGRDASSGQSGSPEEPTDPEHTSLSAEPGQRADSESIGDTDTQHAREDECEESPCRLKNVSLRAEIERLNSRNAELSSKLDAVLSQNSVLASRVDAMFARLDVLTASPGG